jgi:hypothetical protein
MLNAGRRDADWCLTCPVPARTEQGPRMPPPSPVCRGRAWGPPLTIAAGSTLRRRSSVSGTAWARIGPVAFCIGCRSGARPMQSSAGIIKAVSRNRCNCRSCCSYRGRVAGNGFGTRCTPRARPRRRPGYCQCHWHLCAKIPLKLSLALAPTLASKCRKRPRFFRVRQVP